MYLCYDVDMWSIYGMDIRLLKEHLEYKEQIKLLPTRWEKVNKIKKKRRGQTAEYCCRHPAFLWVTGKWHRFRCLSAYNGNPWQAAGGRL